MNKKIIVLVYFVSLIAGSIKGSEQKAKRKTPREQIRELLTTAPRRGEKTPGQQAAELLKKDGRKTSRLTPKEQFERLLGKKKEEGISDEKTIASEIYLPILARYQISEGTREPVFDKESGEVIWSDLWKSEATHTKVLNGIKNFLRDIKTETQKLNDKDLIFIKSSDARKYRDMLKVLRVFTYILNFYNKQLNYYLKESEKISPPKWISKLKEKVEKHIKKDGEFLKENFNLTISIPCAKCASCSLCPSCKLCRKTS
ncbi:MAG: hypothetical protein JW725_02855 [Candidatus Babeliaceae bacterium]|nr:hypothetical protein [Candidatus Babeliaceae bacterium]